MYLFLGAVSHFGFVFDMHMIIVFEKPRLQNVSGPHEDAKASVFKFLRFEEHSRKAPFS